MHVIVKQGFQRIPNPQTEAPCREPFPASRSGNRPLKQERCELLRFSIHRPGIRARLRSAIAVSPPGHCQSRFPARGHLDLFRQGKTGDSCGRGDAGKRDGEIIRTKDD